MKKEKKTDDVMERLGCGGVNRRFSNYVTVLRANARRTRYWKIGCLERFGDLVTLPRPPAYECSCIFCADSKGSS